MLSLYFTDNMDVIVIGLLVGAGLPAIFSLGMASYAYGSGGDAETDHAPGHPLWRGVGVVCFGIVLAGIALGISIIVAKGFGYHVTFENFLPHFEPK